MCIAAAHKYRGHFKRRLQIAKSCWILPEYICNHKTMFKVYVLIISAVILFSQSFAQEVAFHELISAVQKIAAAGEPRNPCKSEQTCLMSEQCINDVCVDPCPGSCGINALCHVKNHKLICKCARCYSGNSNQKCTKYPGFLYKWCKLLF